jgi:cytochrome c biogenesis protein CcmG/thiol:disulfide interchange protein DsbE
MQNNKQWVIRFIGITLVVVAVSMVAWALLTPKREQKTTSTSAKKPVVGLQVGEKAPNFALVTTDGKQIHLSDFLGQPVVILFSATGCSSCETQVSDAQLVYAAQSRAHHVFTLLGIDLSDTSANIMRYNPQVQSAYPVSLSQPMHIGTLYQITGIPTSVFIDRTGIIRAVVEGEMGKVALQHYVEQVGA